jgi:hypothetical protein
MKKLSILFSFLLTGIIAHSQKVSGKLKFEQGENIPVKMIIKTNVVQQAGGQAIDFEMDAETLHTYKVTNTTDDNSTLHHQVQHVVFSFDGMGLKRNFNSSNEKDLNGQFGAPVKEILEKSYDMIIDPAGRTLMAKPEKLELTKMDDRFAIISNMLKDVLDIVQPPLKGKPSFFSIFPDHEIALGETWADSYENESGKFTIAYKLSAITDSTYVIDILGNSNTTSKMEMMGSETVTIMNNKTTGTIIINKQTGIIKEKSSSTDSNGTMQVMGNSLPVTSKTVIKVTVD